MATNPRTYQSQYMRKYYAARMQLARVKLGNRCSKCGATHSLEFHHVHPEKKLGAVSTLARNSARKFWREVEKCILLCSACHRPRCASPPPHRGP